MSKQKRKRKADSLSSLEALLADADQLSVKQERFLKAYSQYGIVAVAARVAGCTREAHAYWMKNDPQYPELFETAREEACDIIRAEIHRRAMIGEEKLIFHKGRKIATIREKSDRLLEFLAKSRMPQEFRERVDINQTGQQELRVVVDENWYGNNAHDLIAEGAAAPSSDSGE